MGIVQVIAIAILGIQLLLMPAWSHEMLHQDINLIGDQPQIYQEFLIAQETNTPPTNSPAIEDKNLAEQIAETPIASKFKLFNIFIIFFVTLGPLKIIPPLFI